MDRIDSYVDGIVNHVQGTSKEKADLKEEMKAHINQMVQELIAEGHKEEESITIALHRFGETNNLKKELSKEYRSSINLKRPIIALGIVLGLILGVLSGYRSYNANKWTSNLLPTDGITIRDKFDSPLISGTATFQGQIDIYNHTVINDLIEYIKSSTNKKPCSEKEANNMDIQKIFYSIGTIRISSSQVPNQLSTINIFKDGTFIAGKINDSQQIEFIKGKLSKEAFDYLDSIYKNPPKSK
jgi:hypothetical protein